MRGSLPAVLVLLLSPAALAWTGPGGAEPDTEPDLDAMWLDADDGVGAARVYFDAFAATPRAVVNPNAQTDGSVALAPAVQYHAILGLWKDCDRDGYVGTAMTALQDYRAELLPGDTPCLEGSLWTQGGWVVEMVMIGMVDPCEYAPDAVRERDCAGPPDAFAPQT